MSIEVTNKPNLPRFGAENEDRRGDEANFRHERHTAMRQPSASSRLPLPPGCAGAENVKRTQFAAFRAKNEGRDVKQSQLGGTRGRRARPALQDGWRNAGKPAGGPVASSWEPEMTNKANLPRFRPKNGGRAEKQSQFRRVSLGRCRSYAGNPRQIPRPNDQNGRHRPGAGSCRGRIARGVKQSQFADGCAGRRFTSFTTMAAGDCFPRLREGTLASLLAMTGMGCGCHGERGLPSAAISSVAYLAKRSSRSEVVLWKRSTEEMTECGGIRGYGRIYPSHITCPLSPITEAAFGGVSYE